MVKIVLDAGHDINTPGKGVATMKEFEFSRAVVQKVANHLAEYDGVEMMLSHNLYDGIDTPLQQRTNLANQWGANCFISVHANAASSSAANGIETFIHPNAPQSTVILTSAIHNKLILATGMNNRGIKRADFHVLRETTMDALLIEGGFMTNPNDLARLRSEEYRSIFAQAIMDGLAQHYGLKKKAAPPPPAVEAPLPPVYTVTVRDFSSEEEVNEFINFARKQYPRLGYHKNRLR